MSLLKFRVAAVVTVIAVALVATAGIQGFTSSNGTAPNTLLVEFHSTFATDSTSNMDKGERKYGEGELFWPGEGPDGEPIGTWQFTEVATEPVGTPGAIHVGVFRLFDQGEIFVSSLTEVVEGFFTHNGAITGGTGEFAGAGGTFTNLSNSPQLIEFNFLDNSDGNGSTFYACFNQASGELKMVAEGEECNGNGQLISWNSEGPQGPAGRPGPPGPLPETFCDLQHQLAKLIPEFEFTEECAEPGPPHEEVDVQMVRKDIFLFGDQHVGFLDSDGDGLTDKQEDILGTDPGWWDTDNDGLGDGEEFHGNTNPYEPGGDPAPFDDPDEDGLSDFQESLLVTDPGQWDSDGDGSSDGDEFWSNADPRDPGSEPQPFPEIPAGTQVDVLIEAEVHVDPEVVPPESAEFPLPVWVSDELIRPPDCSVGYRLPDVWPDNVIEVRYLAVYFDFDEEVFPVDGFVTDLPESDGLRVDLLVALWPGETFFLPENWTVQCENTSHHHFTVHGGAWVGDDRVQDRDESNNHLIVEVPVAVIAEVNAKAAGMEVLLHGVPFGFADSDADDLNDNAEKLLGTDPVNPDSDGDGFLDGHEFWENADPFTPGLDPAPFDNNDADSLTDWQEALLGTDPFFEDTDGDGPWDDHEFSQGGDPLDPAVQPPPDAETPFGEPAWLEAHQLVAVDEETFPQGLGPIDVRVIDHLFVEPEGSATFFVTPEFLAVAGDVFFVAWNPEDDSELELGPDPDGVVTAPPGYQLQVHFIVGVEPGSEVPVVTMWGIDVTEPGHHHVSLYKSAWPEDEHVFELDPANNNFGVSTLR